MIQLDLRDSRPIYEQVKDGLRKLILSGAIATDEKLPSIRQLAASLAVNPNTIQRAIDALEKEGCVYSVPGKGSFAAGPESAGPKRKQELWKSFDTLAEEMKLLGITAQEILQRYESILKKAEKEGSYS